MDNIGDPELLNRLNDLTLKLTQGIKLMGRYGREYARAEHDYKMELAKEAVRLRSTDMPVTQINLVIYGSGDVPNKRFKRDTAQVMYETSKENINVLKLQMRLLESQIDREWKS